MLYTIQNSFLTVRIQNHGAELQSIQSADGTEYLWQGDPTYWADRSPTIFPYIGRMINKRYTFSGREYPMDIHGFAPYLDFELSEQSSTKLVLTLRNGPETQEQYPWKFRFTVTYLLCENLLEITYCVENTDVKSMLFAVGGHPGFNVPLCGGENFTDYYLRFQEGCTPERILFTPDCYVDDHSVPYPLEDGNIIPLRHDLFDNDAIVLKNTPKSVTLESRHGGKSVTVSFPQMDYIGFWHEVKTEAPYVCIEPWSSLPSQKGEKTVLENQHDLLKLDAAQTYQNNWSILIE